MAAHATGAQIRHTRLPQVGLRPSNLNLKPYQHCLQNKAITVGADFLQLHVSLVLSHLLVQESEDRYSPLLTVNGPAEEKLFRSKSAEVELTVEKERVKKMLSEG